MYYLSKNTIFIIVPIYISIILSVNSISAASSLEETIKNLSKNYPANFGLYLKDLKTKKIFTWNADKEYYLSSVIKLFVMITTYKQIHEGKLSLEKTIRIKPINFRDGSTVINWLPLGKKLSVRKLISIMIERSDNAATDLLIDIIGIKAINFFLRKLGYNGKNNILSMLEVRKKIWSNLDPKAQTFSNSDFIEIWKVKSFAKKIKVFQKQAKLHTKDFTVTQLKTAYKEYYNQGYNSSSLTFIGKLLEKIWMGQLISKKVSIEILQHMKKCKTGENRLKAGFPKRTMFFQKTGTQYKTICNVGIAYKHKIASFIIAACIKDHSSRKKAEIFMNKLGHASYHAIIGKEI